MVPVAYGAERPFGKEPVVGSHEDPQRIGVREIEPDALTPSEGVGEAQHRIVVYWSPSGVPLDPDGDREVVWGSEEGAGRTEVDVVAYAELVRLRFNVARHEGSSRHRPIPSVTGGVVRIALEVPKPLVVGHVDRGGHPVVGERNWLSYERAGWLTGECPRVN